MNKKVLRDAANKHRRLILEPFDLIMDLQGFDAICAFSDFMSGSNVYVPSLKTIFQGCLEQEALKNFDGNYTAVARKYGLSERHLRKIVGGK